jgi:DNA-binding NarL/FixJ family response regulator
MKPETPLTPRERQVLDRLSKGNARKVVAADLGITENTVKVHCRSIYSKLGIHSVAEAVRLVCTASVL